MGYINWKCLLNLLVQFDFGVLFCDRDMSKRKIVKQSYWGSYIFKKENLLIFVDVLFDMYSMFKILKIYYDFNIEKVFK